MKFLMFVCLAALMAAVSPAQTRSVTNTDLGKYAEQREKADREYRENYLKRGMPSPEDLDRRRIRNAIEVREYAERMRSRDAEIERILAERRAAMQQSAPQLIVIQGRDGYDYPGYFYGGGNYYGRGGYYGRGTRQYTQPGYFAGGQFWPTGSATPSRPVIRQSPRH